MAGKIRKVRNPDKDDPNVVLVAYPKRRVFNLLITAALVVLFSGWIWANLQKKTVPWYVIGLPIVFIGMLANFLQPEEEWQYTPWQEATQKYEKNIHE